MAALHPSLPDEDSLHDASHGDDQLLSHTERTRVARRRFDDGTSLIVKRGFGPESIRRLRHEAAMLRRLHGVEGVSRLGPARDNSPELLVLEDDGGVALSQVLAHERLDTDAVLKIGLQLARILSAVHRRGVVHRDINPANVLLAGAARRPVLIDFNIASSFAEEAPGFVHQSEIAGTLAYMAPEQTGRTGRTVDQRADLYALGATLYEMATGRLAFEGDDPLQLIHDQLVRVPEPPVALNPGLPRVLSDIVMRLLEKESDRRYQSAEGLVADLARVAECHARGEEPDFELGQRDFPARLLPPSRLVGRDTEIAALRDAFERSMSGKTRAVLVSGAPGVGKTALINELRPVVTAQRGWFVSGKFDQCRRDVASSAVVQAIRTLGRLLLSQPEAELLALRAELLRGLGANAGLMAGVLPEFAALLNVEPETAADDPLVAEARLYQAGVALMRTIASPARPVVMVIDDLQWAGAGSIRFFDALLADASLSNLLLVGAYREAEVDAAHPLTPMMERWVKQGTAPSRLALRNLAGADLSTLLQEMLRLPPEGAARLADAVGQRTGGNPFDTVELLNALRHEGALVLTEQGWQWEAEAIRRHVGQGEVVDLLTRRIDRLPAPTRELLEIMACMSGEADMPLLQAAGGLPADEIERRAEPALEEGLLLLERSGSVSLRFRHDRVQQAAYARLEGDARREGHLRLARRLAAQPAWTGMAAEQYLRVTDELRDPLECRQAAGLFHEAALQSLRINYTLAEKLLRSAIELLSRVETAADRPTLLALRTRHVATLYCLGRHDGVDAAYQDIQRSGAGPLELAEAAGLRLTSLYGRGRHVEAVEEGMALLQRLSPLPDDTSRTHASEWEDMKAWAAQLDPDADAGRPESTDPQVLAASSLLYRLAPPAFLRGPEMTAHVMFHARRLWVAYGPSYGLISAISQCSGVAIPLHQDFRISYAIVRYLLRVAQLRGYDMQVAQLRISLFSLTQHWSEPLENCVRGFQPAREAMLAGGAPMTASITYSASALLLVECAPSLEAVSSDYDAGESLAKRLGNSYGQALCVVARQLVRALRGQTDEIGGFCDAEFSEATYMAGPGQYPLMGGTLHVTRALSAAIFGDHDALVKHAEPGFRLWSRECHYGSARAYMLQALALALQLQAADVVNAEMLRTQLDACSDWMAARAADMPANYGHLSAWIDAERAWASGEDLLALRLFDKAMRDAGRRPRPWHLALATERCAQFHFSRGLEWSGRRLMHEAKQTYEAWGASGKVAEMVRQHPYLKGGARSLGGSHGGLTRTTGVLSDHIDMVAILRASQALSSETSLPRLQASVSKLLCTLTGATRVSMLLRGEDGSAWSMMGEHGKSIPEEAAAQRGMLPLSAFRYAQRTRETLVVEDAVTDDRFAHDAYFVGVERCSLLVVPILSQGELRAVLMLENRQSRGAFSADRLDAVMLIAGQLAVSLDNAMLYASLERKVAERTEALEQANHRLEMLSVTDPLTGLANRRRFTEVLDSEWKRALRTGGPIGLVMIDIDQFKLYNDHYGHLGGDACLRKVAACLKDSQRAATDLVARYGGEEFVLVLPNTDLAGVHVVAERLRSQVEAMREPHAKATHGIVTISMGITSFVPTENSTVAENIEVADAALYEAKRAGRNRVWGQARPQA